MLIIAVFENYRKQTSLKLILTLFGSYDSQKDVLITNTILPERFMLYLPEREKSK